MRHERKTRESREHFVAEWTQTWIVLQNTFFPAYTCDKWHKKSKNMYFLCFVPTNLHLHWMYDKSARAFLFHERDGVTLRVFTSPVFLAGIIQYRSGWYIEIFGFSMSFKILSCDVCNKITYYGYPILFYMIFLHQIMKYNQITIWHVLLPRPFEKRHGLLIPAQKTFAQVIGV